MTVDLCSEAVERRLREAAQASDLSLERRLWAKIDYSAQGIEGRLAEVDRARRACLELAALKGTQSDR